MATYIRKGTARSLADGALAVLMALITPLLEKNLAKALATPAGAFVFSMSRLIVLAFAPAMLRQVWHAGVGGWPDATLAIAIVLALPLLGALDRATPDQVLALGSALIGRFGIGDVRLAGWSHESEPLLANVVLHYVLDLWAHRWRQRNARGRVSIVRYADDFVMGFQTASDARQMRDDLQERLAQFGLALHDEKTRVIEFGRLPALARKQRARVKGSELSRQSAVISFSTGVRLPVQLDRLAPFRCACRSGQRWHTIDWKAESRHSSKILTRHPKDS